MVSTFNFRTKAKIDFLSDHKSQQKGLRGWKMSPTHTHTPWVLKFHDLRLLGLIRDLSKARNILGLTDNPQNENYSLILIRVINLSYSLISKKVTNLVQLRSLGYSVNPNYHFRNENTIHKCQVTL